MKHVNAHVEFSSEAQYVDFSNEEKFLKDYSEILEHSNHQEILKEVKAEVDQRRIFSICRSK